ncbi:uncharacterized protein LOC134186467 [Corticium candelabrum]|uniref:uncharacterized protein LOC134186467 n=1 Tax=Corticium candelabrum TaxID=121492 RepID=UPI002E26F09D|nr:uncharacterized protein LOC134186467 [Corticium candelabrum]
MPRGGRRKGFRKASAGSKSTSSTLKFEDYEKVFIGPLVTLILGFATYVCKNYWNKFPDVEFYETVVVAACLAGIFVTLLFLPVIVYNLFTSKRSAIIVLLLCLLVFIVVVVPITQLLWGYFSNGNQAELPTVSDEVVTVDDRSSSNMEKNKNNLTGQEESHERVSHQETSDVLNSNVQFNGDCLKYSQQLLSQPNVLRYPRKYHIHTQVEMLQRTVLLKGKPTFLVFSDDSDPPSQFEGDALDLYNRKNNAGAQSFVSVYDAVEKALTLLCNNLLEQGFGNFKESS